MDSKYFGTRYAPHEGRTRVWKAICEYLQPFIPPESVIADVGAGYCDFINQIEGSKKYAVDINPEAARWCGQDVQFLLAAPIQDIELPDQSVDVVMVSNLLEHLTPADCSALLDSFDRILKKDGRIIAIQPNYFYSFRRYWDDFTHVRAFSHESLRDLLLSRGYKLVTLEKRFLPFSLKSRLPKSYWLTKLYLASFWRPAAGQMLAIVRR